MTGHVHSLILFVGMTCSKYLRPLVCITAIRVLEDCAVLFLLIPIGNSSRVVNWYFVAFSVCILYFVLWSCVTGPLLCHHSHGPNLTFCRTPCYVQYVGSCIYFIILI